MSDSVRPHRRQPTRLPRPWDCPSKNTGVGCHFLFQCMKVKSQSEVAQSCPTLSDPMDCSRPGSSVHGIFQARGLEWGAIAFSVLYSKGPPNLKSLRFLYVSGDGLFIYLIRLLRTQVSLSSGGTRQREKKKMFESLPRGVNYQTVVSLT